MKALFAAVLMLFVSACNSVAVKPVEPVSVKSEKEPIALEDLGAYLTMNSDIEIVDNNGVPSVRFCFVIEPEESGCLWWPLSVLFSGEGVSI